MYFKGRQTQTPLKKLETCNINTAYSIASSCIANRFKVMKGSYIGEIIRLLYDVLQYAETKTLPGLLLMVDFVNAFDSV